MDQVVHHLCSPSGHGARVHQPLQLLHACARRARLSVCTRFTVAADLAHRHCNQVLGATRVRRPVLHQNSCEDTYAPKVLVQHGQLGVSLAQSFTATSGAVGVGVVATSAKTRAEAVCGASLWSLRRWVVAGRMRSPRGVGGTGVPLECCHWQSLRGAARAVRLLQRRRAALVRLTTTSGCCAEGAGGVALASALHTTV